jgi:gas vesicle protein
MNTEPLSIGGWSDQTGVGKRPIRVTMSAAKVERPFTVNIRKYAFAVYYQTDPGRASRQRSWLYRRFIESVSFVGNCRTDLVLLAPCCSFSLNKEHPATCTTGRFVMNDARSYGSATVAFLAGALIGAGAALLLAPQSGTETRSMLRDYAGRAKDELRERSRQAKATLDTAKERGREAFEFAKERGKEAYASVKETARETSTEGFRSRI